jgi:outer membrane lipoprotein carrier protein
VGRRGRAAALLAAALVLAAPGGAAEPPPGLERLRKFLGRVQTLRADFTQEIVDADKQVVETARGRVALQRPGRFRWDYESPYERVVLADGEHLWLYEADLQQATVRPLTAGLGETPAALLTGGREVLERFEVVSSWSGEDLAWVKLKPRSTDSDFDAVSIGFRGDQPVRLEIDDRLGQQTRIALGAISTNQPLAAGTFRFEVPAGVDVIREGEL